MKRELLRSVNAETGKPPTSSPPPQCGGVYRHVCSHTHDSNWSIHFYMRTEPFYFYFFLLSCILGAAPQQQEDGEDCEVPPKTDIPVVEDPLADTENSAPPHEESNHPANDEEEEEAEEEEEEEESEEDAEEQDEATERHTTEAGQEESKEEVDRLEPVSSDQKPEPKTDECAKEEQPELPKEEGERREEEGDEEDEDDDESDDDDDDEAEDEAQELRNSTETHNNTLKTNGHAVVDANHPSDVVPIVPSPTPLLCPLVESELSATDRDASDASYELFNGETAALRNGGRHRATAPRFPELPLDPDVDECEPEEGETNLNPDAERSRTVSSSSTGDTPKGATHTDEGTDDKSLTNITDIPSNTLYIYEHHADGGCIPVN